MTEKKEINVNEANETLMAPDEYTSHNETLTVIRGDVPPAELIESLTNASNELFCSITDDGTRKTKVRIYNAIQADHEELSRHLNEVLEVVDVVAYPISVVNELGELSNILRTVLICADGKTYSAGSIGVTNSLSKIFAILGTPHDGAWHDEPVKMVCRSKASRNNAQNSFNYLELVD
jgi:hypothetical protein